MARRVQESFAEQKKFEYDLPLNFSWTPFSLLLRRIRAGAQPQGLYGIRP